MDAELQGQCDGKVGRVLKIQRVANWLSFPSVTTMGKDGIDFQLNTGAICLYRRGWKG